MDIFGQIFTTKKLRIFAKDHCINSKNSWQFLVRLCLHSPRDYSIAMTRADTRWTNLAQFLTPGIMGNQRKEITEIRENEENRRKVD